MKSVFTYLFCSAIAFSGFAQNLCNNSSFEKGDFNLSSANVCLPGIITTTDLSGGTNIKYVFDYKDQSLETVKAIAFSTNNFSYSVANYPKTSEVTVLQIGTKNGKTSIACKTLNLRLGRAPIYSYSVCDPATPTANNPIPVEVSIPVNPLNDYDTYTLNFGTGTAPFTINKSDLPYKASRSISLPRAISITGQYNTATNNCPVTAASNAQIQRLTSTFTGIIRAHNANISELELINAKTAKITFNGVYNTDPNNLYNIFMYPKGTPPPTTNPIKAMNGPGTFTVNIPDSTRSYCFYAQRYNSCSFVRERSVEICTHPLYSATFGTGPFRYDLRYDSYPNIVNTTTNLLLYGILINPTKNIIKIVDNNRTQIAKGTGSTVHTDNPIDCKKRYCYQVEHSISGMFNFVAVKGKSISNQICVDRTKIIAPKLTDALVNTEMSNLNRVTIVNNVNWQPRRSQFELHRLDGNKYVKIDSVLSPLLVLNDRVPVQKANLYKVSYIDECNSKSALSDSMSSVFLNYNLPNFISWNKEKPFMPNSINNYELIPLAETDQAAMPGKIYAKTLFGVQGDLDPYEKTAYFRLKINSDGVNPKVSFSNLISIPITPVMYLPSAFSPNGDGINDLLGFKGKTQRFTTASFKLYSRNGEMLLELNSVKDEWDGNLNGKPAPVGIYAYEFRSTVDDGTKYNKKGLIEIMR